MVHLTSGRTVPVWDVFLTTQPAPSSPIPAPSFNEGGHAGDGTALEADGPDVATMWTAPVPDVTPTPLQVVEHYHLDALGSVHAVTDAQGQVIARHDFLPFGEELLALPLVED